MKVVILCGSVFGAAEDVARHAQAALDAAGLHAWLALRSNVQAIAAFAPDAVLAVTSTTGMGELPDNLMDLYSELRDTLPAAWRGLPGGVIALGDASYDTFCGGGELISELFAELGVQPVLPMLRLDASETVTPETDAEPWLAQFIAAVQAHQV